MPDRPPNILLVTTDQQRRDTCGPWKPSWMRTPHVDQLCHEGIVYHGAYSECPVCVPARISIMNGKYAATHGMTGNGASSAVMGREGTLPTLLRELGYQTCAVGKMHFGPQRVRHGFEEMLLPDDYYREMSRGGHPLQPMRHGLGQNELYPTLATVPEPMTLTAWTAERCVDYIRDRRDPSLPFFLWCSFSKPHPPFDPPEPYYSMYKDAPIAPPAIAPWDDDERCPPILRETRQGMKYDLIPPEVIRAARAAYYGLITQIDYNLGRVLGALTETGEYANTLILYTSDHGEMLGDHRTGAKCYPYEGSARIPFVLRLPKTATDRMHGAEVRVPVTHADILPTLVRYAGGTPPAETDGIDLIELARRPDAPHRPYLVTVGGANVECVAILDGRWKYFWFPAGGREQLFDTETDPQELSDLAETGEAAPERERLREALEAHLRERGSPYLEDGRLRAGPVETVAPRDLRAGCGAGWRTEYEPQDVRH